jgi:hypothetical protein
MNLREISERIGIRPRRFVLLLLGFAVVLVAAPLAILGFSSALGCSEEERQAFVEFPQYGGVKMEPVPSEVTGGCAVFYDTPDSPEKVSAYFVEQLKAHGWAVDRRSEGGGFEGTLVEAHRDGYAYEVGYESRKFYSPPKSGLHLAVHVFKDSQQKTMSCGSAEKAALAEFPHYGGKEVGKDLKAFPLPGKAKGACVTGYPAKGASQEQVSTYYEKKLTEHGWKVKQLSSSTEASRDGLRYVARYWHNPGSTEVEVQVFKDE